MIAPLSNFPYWLLAVGFYEEITLEENKAGLLLRTLMKLLKIHVFLNF